MDWMPDAIRDGIIVTLIISGPLVLIAAFIGLVIGILQAATQVQEQTIGSALKIIGVFAIIIFAGFWMFQYLSQYTYRTFSKAFSVVPRLTQKVVPPNAFTDAKELKMQKAKTQKSQPIKIEPPEKIETQEFGGGIIGSPLLGVPEAPIKPPVSKIQPPDIPKPPIEPYRPQVPLQNFQEPFPIPEELEE